MPFLESLVHRSRKALLAYIDPMPAWLDESTFAPDLLNTKFKVIDSLGHSTNAIFRNHEPAASDFRCQKVSEVAEAVLDKALKTAFESMDAFGDFFFGLDDNFGCGAWRRGTQVSDEVGNGEIHFVPDGGNDRLP